MAVLRKGLQSQRKARFPAELSRCAMGLRRSEPAHDMAGTTPFPVPSRASAKGCQQRFLSPSLFLRAA